MKFPGAVDAVSCRIAFERGKERTFLFLALSSGVSGWIVLAEESPSKPDHGIVRVTAPLAGCNVRTHLHCPLLNENACKDHAQGQIIMILA